ncbi:MAG: tail protein X [Blautia sp.]|nr:tail protein X [Blautia sp.]
MGGYYYTTKQGDMWDYIAWMVYGDETMMERLLNAEENREIMDIYIFSAGVKVWCPEVTGQTASNDLAPWREG